MTYLSQRCVTTKKMLAKLAHKKYLKKATNSKKIKMGIKIGTLNSVYYIYSTDDLLLK